MTTLGPAPANADSLGLDHMRAFLAVVETGSQVRAAKRLGVAQTTVCRHIERVQEHFGGGLFEAGSSGRLSTRGALVEQSIRTAMAELTRARDRLAVERPVLRIGFIYVMRPLLERALRGLAKERDGVDFDVRMLQLQSEAQAQALARRELDIAICYVQPELGKRDGIEETIISAQPYALAMPERACVRGKPSTAVLSSLTYAYSPRGPSSAIAAAERAWLASYGLAPTRRIECAAGGEILAYAGAGHGYGFLPALWSTVSHEGTVFAPAPSPAAVARIAAYSVAHVSPWAIRLRERLSEAARRALEEIGPK